MKKPRAELVCNEELARALGAYGSESFLTQYKNLLPYCIRIKTMSEQGSGTLVWPLMYDDHFSVTSKGIKITS